MKAVFLHSLGRSRGQILGWGAALFVLGLMMVPFYPTIATQRETFEVLIASYPKEILAFFGDFEDFAMITTPEGFLSTEFFSFMPLVLGFYAVLAGSGLLADDEERGTLELVLAHPVSRSRLFFGRGLSLIAALLAILAIAWVGLVLPKLWVEFELGVLDVLKPFASLLALLVLFASFALVLSMLLPSRRAAAMTSGALLVVSFFVTGLARVIEQLEDVARLSPLTYYQTLGAFRELNVEWLGGLMAAAAAFTLVAWWRFERRDVRVAGEGSWEIGFLRRGRAPS